MKIVKKQSEDSDYHLSIYFDPELGPTNNGALMWFMNGRWYFADGCRSQQFVRSPRGGWRIVDGDPDLVFPSRMSALAAWKVMR
jgi:hypothetical protein